MEYRTGSPAIKKSYEQLFITLCGVLLYKKNKKKGGMRMRKYQKSYILDTKNT